MSGTAYGTVILHTTPEAAAGGPLLAIVRDGDYIELDVPNRKLHLDVSQAEIKRRLATWKSPVEARLAATPNSIMIMSPARTPAPTSIS
jgi:dihydroxy-acid dehydratase